MPKIKMICETCKKEFDVFPYRKKTAHFCSGKCSTTIFKKGMTSWLKGTKGLIKPNSGQFKKGIIPKTCWKKGHKTWNKGIQYIQITGANHPNWNGGIRHQDGYIYIYSPNHPFKSKQGYVALHRLIMEKSIKRFLTKSELVHHINENKSDNRLENLLICTRKEHLDIHR